MAEQVKVTYDGVEISYIEGRDRWVFELRGRERSADSLALAKQAIDKPAPKEKVPFVRVSAYRSSYGDAFQPCEITSIAENDYGRPQVWLTYKDGNRRKEAASSVYPVCEHNDAIIARWRELEKQREELNQKMQVLIGNLKSSEVPKEQ